MEIRISSGASKIEPGLRNFIQERMSIALGRFAPRIESLTVRLTDLNGPRGGIDKRCRIEARLRPTAIIEADVIDSEFEPAIHRAAERLARRIRDHLDRKRTARRGVSAAGESDQAPVDDARLPEPTGD